MHMGRLQQKSIWWMLELLIEAPFSDSLKSELTLNHDLSDIFGNWCSLNSHPPRLHNPLGLSQGLKSSLSGHQLGAKKAAIALLFWAESDVMAQSPTRGMQYVFYGVKYIRYCPLSEAIQKFASLHTVHTKMPRSLPTMAQHTTNQWLPPGLIFISLSICALGLSV